MNLWYLKYKVYINVTRKLFNDERIMFKFKVEVLAIFLKLNLDISVFFSRLISIFFHPGTQTSCFKFYSSKQ